MVEMRRIEIEEIGGVTVVKFVDEKIMDEGNIQIMGNQMFGLVDEDGRKKIILDFSNVKYLHTAALSKFTTMNKRAKNAKSRLRFCCISGQPLEVFTISLLNRLFDIFDTLEEALEGF